MLNLYKNEKILFFFGLAAAYLILLAINHSQPKVLTSIISAVSDNYYSHSSKKANTDIVFISIDHKSVKKHGRWPWPRETIANGLSKLENASVVALDIVFSEATTSNADNKLSEVLSEINSLGGVFLDSDSKTFSTYDLDEQLINSSLIEKNNVSWIQSQSIEPNVESISSSLSLVGALNTVSDPDSRLRKYPLGLIFKNAIIPSLGLQALRLHLNQDVKFDAKGNYLHIGNHKIPFNENGLTRPTLYPESAFTTYSFAELSQPSFDPMLVKDKIVLVGITEAGVTDIRSTPLGLYPGPLVHASFISSVLDNQIHSEITLLQKAGLMALVMLLTLIALTTQRTPVRYFLYLLLLSAYWFAGLVLATKLNVWIEPGIQLLGIIITAVLIEITLLTHGRHQIAKLETAFSSYLPAPLAKKISQHPDQLALGGEKKDVTILFSDIRGFTSMSEKIPPELLAEVMNIYFDPLTKIIFKHGGTLDKYIGDAIMAIFNAPIELPNHTLAACNAAIEMQQAHEEINNKLATLGISRIKTGIGINTGIAAIGNFGSSIRFSYTAFGDTVNMASRLESSTKKCGADILISMNVHNKIKNTLPCEPMGKIEIAGKADLQEIFELKWK